LIWTSYWCICYEMITCTSRACDEITSESLAELRLDEGALQAYAAALDPTEVQAAAELPRLPIRFDDQQSEARLSRG